MTEELTTTSQNSSDIDLLTNIQMQVPLAGPPGGKRMGGSVVSRWLGRGEEYEEGGFLQIAERKWGLFWVLLGCWAQDRGVRIWNRAESRLHRDKNVTKPRDVTLIP